MLMGAEIERGEEVPARFARVRGHRMAKAALENAVWDADARRKQLPLWKLLGGSRREIIYGVSIGIQDSVEQLMGKIETELAAGYRRIKLKVKPGWDLEVLDKVRMRWPDIVLSCDANSAYRLDEVKHLQEFDRFNLLMIEQPLWNDDIYFHARLQKQIKTLESQRSQKRRTLFDAQDDVDKKREQLIAEIEGKLQQQLSAESLFVIRWELAG